MTDLIEQTIGQYLIIEEIGRGGMATVYRGFQSKIGRDVAIKVLPAQFTHDPTFLARFTREIEIAARLQHHQWLPKASLQQKLCISPTIPGTHPVSYRPAG